MRKSEDSFVVQITSAVVMDGEIIKRGELIEVSKQEAESLLHRGKAVLADESMVSNDQGHAPSRFEELDAMKVDDLKAFAAENGHDLGEATKKADIIAAILAAEQAA